MTHRLTVLLVLIGLACPAGAATVTEVHYVMGTYFRISAEHPDAPMARAALRRCFVTARQLDESFSRFDPHSELSRLNADGGSAVTVSAEMAALLQRAEELRAATDGRFDVSVGALTALWRNTPRWPSPQRIAAAQRRAGRDAFMITGSRLMRRPGVQLDLDGIAKGWAVDRCVAQLRAEGIESAFLNFGESSLYALGVPAGAAAWPVTVRGLAAAETVGTLWLRDQAASVSSVYGHARRLAKRAVGHLVDPRSGRPLVQPGMALVVAASATDAEAFSKAVLIADDPAVLRHSRSMEGVILIRPDAVRRLGRISFRAFSSVQSLTAAAEPLR